MYLLSWVSLPLYPPAKDFCIQFSVFCRWVLVKLKAIGELNAGRYDGSVLSSRQKFGYTLPQIKDLLNSCEMNVPQLPKIGSNFRESFGKVWMGKSRNYKNCARHYQTALGAGVYYWKAAGSIIPQTSWGRMDPDRGGSIYKKRPE